jgi:hypothetical protein
MKHGARYETTAEQTADHPDERECDRCGRPRPTDPERFTITASDFTDATADFERALLCVECWRQYRDDLRRCVA